VHKSVLIKEALGYLRCENKRIMLDCTVGGGGHAKEILKSLPPGGRLIGIDQDQSALKIAEETLREFEGSFTLVKENFRNLDKVLNSLGIEGVDGMLFDLGLSSFQLEDEERGFSFSKSGPLDMRMDRSKGRPLEELLRRLSEQELGQIIRDLGEERYWRKIASAIVRERKRAPIKSSLQLADLVRSTVRYRPGQRIDPATRTFQGLRIFLNDELGALEEALEKAGSFLRKDGIIAAISFHSLEDRIVKNRFKQLSKEGIVEILTKKPIRPAEEEISDNPRSRSARLRAARRI
jgi:16S rRNA (cytosine1402-N4)-methyltransferase